MHMTRGYRLGLFFMALLFSLTRFSGKAQAQIIGELEADIPFSFHAGNAKFPAGKYMIRVVDNTDLSLLEISSADGATSALFDVRPTQAKSSPAKSELIFSKYGNRYFLEKLLEEAEPDGREVVESRYEKRVAEAASECQEHVPARTRKREQANSN